MYNMNIGKEFENYAVKHMGIGSNKLHAVAEHQVKSSMTQILN